MAYYESLSHPSNWGLPFTAAPTFLILHGSGQSRETSTENELAYLQSERDTPWGYHMFITRTGDIHIITPLDRVAYHAGVSNWREDGQSWNGLNAVSIGVAFENTNRPGDPITSEQINAVTWLRLHKLEGFRNDRVLTHKDVSYPRKTDPDNLTVDQMYAVRQLKYVSNVLVLEDKDIEVIRKPYMYTGTGDKVHIRFMGSELCPPPLELNHERSS